MRHIKMTLLVCALVAFATNSQAQEPFAIVSTYAFHHLSLAPGTRNLALGHVGAADDADPMNQFYNPAILVTFEGAGLSYGHADLPVGMNLFEVSAQAGHRFAVNDNTGLRFAASVRFKEFSIETDPSRTIFLPEGAGREFSPDTDVALALAGGVSAGFFDAGVGFAAKRIDAGFADVQAWTYDVGLLMKATFGQEALWRVIPSVGVSVLNAGDDIDLAGRPTELPKETRVGAAVRAEISQMQVAGRGVPVAAVSLVGDMIDAPLSDDSGWGVELALVDVVFGRFGYRLFDDTLIDNTSTMGLGVAWSFAGVRVSLDYSNYEQNMFGDTDAYGAGVSYSF